MTLTTWQFTSWYYVNAQHLSFSTTLHFVAQPLSSFSILGCHHLNEGAINYKRAIVVDCDCFHLLLSCSPTTPLALSPSVPLSCALSCSILPPPSLDFLLKAERKYGTFPNWFFSSSCISNCVFTNKLGEVAEDICPGARPVYSFQLCVYELCSCLLPIKSRFYFPLPIFPVPLPPLLFPSSTFPSSSSTCSLPAKPGRTGGFFSSVSLEPPPFYLPLYYTLHLSSQYISTLLWTHRLIF